MDPKHKKEIKIRHESDASQNATTLNFTARIMIMFSLFKIP